MSTLLNLSGKIDPQTIAVFETVSQATADLEVPYVVVGATARDLVLHYGHGANIQRATHDVDFAIEVPNWAAFDALKGRLCAQGFRATHAQHRLVSDRDAIVDIVPFGPIEDEQASIAWPPIGYGHVAVYPYGTRADTDLDSVCTGGGNIATNDL